jgi:hypothetical protein
MVTHLKTVMVHILDTLPVPTLWPIGPRINSEDLVPYTDATGMMPDVIPKMGDVLRHGIVDLPRAPSFEEDQSKGN